MKRADIQKKMEEQLILQVALEAQMEGTRKLYEAALLVNASDGAVVFRDNLHTLLDSKLDSIASVMVLSRQLVTATD